MGNRISQWLEDEPIPRDLHARVMSDPRLAAAGGSVFRTRFAFATAALVVLLVGGGLGTILLRGTHPGGTATVGSSSPSPSATVEPSPSPSVPVPVVSPSSQPPVSPCKTADLSVTIGASSGAAGTLYAPIDAQNKTMIPCTLMGFFGLALLDASGKQVGGNPTRDPNQPPPPGPVVLAPGASATFTFHWSDVQSGAQPCPTAAQVELTAPNQYDHVFIAAKTADGTTIAPCSPGGIGLTAVRPK